MAPQHHYPHRHQEEETLCSPDYTVGSVDVTHALVSLRRQRKYASTPEGRLWQHYIYVTVCVAFASAKAVKYICGFCTARKIAESEGHNVMVEYIRQ